LEAISLEETHAEFHLYEFQAETPEMNCQAAYSAERPMSR